MTIISLLPSKRKLSDPKFYQLSTTMKLMTLFIGLLQDFAKFNVQLYTEVCKVRSLPVNRMLIATGVLFAVISVIAHVTSAGAIESWPTNGWERATPDEMGMNRTKLQKARDYALTGGGSGFITRRGRLVMAWGSKTKRYDLKSTTKSIGITALGLAIKDGRIKLRDKAKKHHPGIGIPPKRNVATGWLDDITILNLATLTAGFDISGGYIDLLSPPGTTWAYTNGGANWLAECITLAYRQDLNTLMFDRVLKPLGIKTSDLTWRDNRYRPDTINGIKRREFGSGISANVDAMARIGYLYLRGGKWNGRQVIPQSFVDMARTAVPGVVGLPVVNDTKSRFANAPNHYGLLWWNNADGTLTNVPTDAYWSYGLYESFIVVIPSFDIVVARAGSAWRGNRNPNYYKILKPFLQAIVGSVRGSHR